MTFHDAASRWLTLLGAIFGAAGVMLAAAASHGGDERLLGSAAQIALAHGPALLALGFYGLRTRLLRAAGALIGGGTILFAGDLLFRHFSEMSLFTGAAPIGGVSMIAGWAVLVVAIARKRP